MFRFACELVRPVEEAILQQALDRTLEEFPGFLCVLKHGLFWYYLEASDQRPVVHPENQPPCSALYKQNESSLLFDVSYYRCRINLEVHHVLSDGTGAVQFLRVLVYHYLLLRDGERWGTAPPGNGCGCLIHRKNGGFLSEILQRAQGGKADAVPHGLPHPRT